MKLWTVRHDSASCFGNLRVRHVGAARRHTAAVCRNRRRVDGPGVVDVASLPSMGGLRRCSWLDVLQRHNVGVRTDVEEDMSGLLTSEQLKMYRDAVRYPTVWPQAPMRDLLGHIEALEIENRECLVKAFTNEVQAGIIDGLKAEVARLEEALSLVEVAVIHEQSGTRCFYCSAKTFQHDWGINHSWHQPSCPTRIAREALDGKA